MKFKIIFSDEAKDQFLDLENRKNKVAQYKAVGKTLAFMENNLRHPSLNTHKFDELTSPFQGEVFESYAQNNSPGAYRVYWCYGPDRGSIYIIAITPHP